MKPNFCSYCGVQTFIWMLWNWWQACATTWKIFFVPPITQKSLPLWLGSKCFAITDVSIQPQSGMTATRCEQWTSKEYSSNKTRVKKVVVTFILRTRNISLIYYIKHNTLSGIFHVQLTQKFHALLLNSSAVASFSHPRPSWPLDLRSA